MIDLFGLGKQPPEPQPEQAAEPAAPEAPPRGSHKLWAFLLVLDSVFVIVFAGAVAAKIYQHWKAPVLAPVQTPRRRPVKTVEAPAPSTAPAPAPEPVKPPEPPKAPEPKAVAAKPGPEGQRPPKPSMLADAPKHRETPALADAGGKPAAKPAPATPVAPGAPVKALRTEFKLHAPHAKAVELVGAFIVRGGRKDMSKSDDGTWTVTLYLNPGNYRYFFSVDKKKQLDPENPHSEKGASLLAIP